MIRREGCIVVLRPQLDPAAASREQVHRHDPGRDHPRGDRRQGLCGGLAPAEGGQAG